MTASRTCILVLGMHRSGTSALTRVVSLLGAALPKEMIPPMPENSAGFWESVPITTLNGQLLTEAGSRWDDWRTFHVSALKSDRLEFYKKAIGNLILAQYADAPLFVLKDPRICRLVSLYDEVFADLGIATRFIHSIRNPVAVRASLETRNGLTPYFGGLVWLRHVLDAEAATRGSSRSFVSYEGLMENWHTALSPVEGTLDIVWPNPPERCADEIDASLKPELQHHAPQATEFDADPDFETWIRETYKLLLEFERPDGERQAAFDELSRIKTEFDRASAIFGKATFPEIAAREGKTRQLEARIAGLAERGHADAASAAAEKAKLEQRMSELSLQASELSVQKSELSLERAKLLDQLSESDGERRRLLTAFERQAASLKAAFERAATLDAELSRARASLFVSDGVIDRLNQEISRLDLSVAAVARDAEAARAEAARLRGLVDLVYASSSWRLTSPLRSVVTAARRIASAFWRTPAGINPHEDRSGALHAPGQAAPTSWSAIAAEPVEKQRPE